LIVEWNWVAQQFDLGSRTDICKSNRPWLARNKGSRMSHSRDWRGDSIDRLKGGRLFLSRGNHNLARHAIEAGQNSRSGPVLAIDDGDFPPATGATTTGAKQAQVNVLAMRFTLRRPFPTIGRW
jgi:hypothetical protein